MSRANCFRCFLTEEKSRPKLKHSRAISGKISLIFSSYKTLRKAKTRKNSLTKVKKPKSSKKLKQKELLALAIKSLKGKEIYRGPKIFENQFFRDVYDKFGNHDRVFELIPEMEVIERRNIQITAPSNSLADQSTHETRTPVLKANKNLRRAFQQVPKH